MDVSCVMLSTAKRINWLSQSIDSIDLLNFNFKEKILSIDEFDGYKIDDDLIKKYTEKGWIIDIVSLKSKHIALQRVVNMVTSDYVFYAEDDVLITKLPTEINEILSNIENNRVCGILSMNLGGSKLDYPKHMGDMPSWLDNTIFDNNEIIAFLRLESEASKWFLEFPSVFFNVKMLRTILTTPQLSNNMIEEGLTKSYFDNNCDKEYYKASICYTKIKDVISLLLSDSNVSFWNEKLEGTKMYKILDANQGGAIINLEKINYV